MATVCLPGDWPLTCLHPPSASFQAMAHEARRSQGSSGLMAEPSVKTLPVKSFSSLLPSAACSALCFAAS
eukprot:15697717-Heterocapsa_arctica.AAC.1